MNSQSAYAFVLLLIVVASWTTNDLAANEPPNVVIIFIDDMGWADFSCFGNTEVETENIDQLAREGIRFEQFYVNSPICSPSRTALTTGQYPQRWRIHSFLASRKYNKNRMMANWLDPSAPSLARILNAHGYATGHFGKWHMGGQRDVGDAPLISEYGFDESLTNFEGLGKRLLALKHTPYSNKPTKHALKSDTLGSAEDITWVDRSEVTKGFADAALKFIKSAEAKRKPFYVNVWPDDVHTPMVPKLDQWPEGAKHETAEGKRKLYKAVLDEMDRQLAPLFDYVKQSESLRDNTLILICSDNGPEINCGSAGPLRGTKVTLYEGGIRSPLIAWGPKLIAGSGKVNKTSVFSAIDLVPSLISICGADAGKAKFDGEDLAEVLFGKSEAKRSQPIFFRRPPDRKTWKGMTDLPDLAVRLGKWKLLCNHDGDRTQLYDIPADPGESKNVAALHPQIVHELREQLLTWHESMPDPQSMTIKKIHSR